MRKFWFSLVLPALLLAATAPCLHADDPRTLIHISGTIGADPRNIGGMINSEVTYAFTRKFPQYGFKPVKTLRLHNQGAMDGFVMSLLGDRAPDIISIPFRNSTSLIDQGFMLPLDDFYEEWGKEVNLSEVIHPVTWPVINQQGHIYFVPGNPGFTALYYRKDLLEQAGFDRPPADWDELYVWAQKMTRPEQNVWGYGVFGSPNRPVAWHWVNFIKQAGGDVFRQDADGRWRGAVDSDGGVKALKFYHKMLRAPWTRDGKTYRGVSRLQLHTLWDELAEGTIAMVIGGGDYRILFNNNLGINTNPDQIGMAPLPAGPAGYASMANASLKGINGALKDPDRIRAAWEYLRFQRSDEAEYIAVNLLVSHGFAPYINPILLRKYGFERYIKDIPEEWLRTYELMSANAFPEPYLRGTNNIYGVMEPALHAISVNDDVDYREELRKIDERINSKLLGYVPDDVRRHRRFITRIIVLVIGTLVLAQVIRMLVAAARNMRRAPNRARLRRLRRRVFARRNIHITALVMMLPAILTLLAWQYVPIVRSFVVAVTDFHIHTGSRFVGLDNFSDALWQPDFWIGVRNTAVYVILTVVMGFIGPVILAILLNEIRVGSMWLRVIYFLPAAVGPLVVSLLWVNFYDPTAFGLFNRIIMALGLPQQQWLQNSATAMICVIVPGIWQTVGIGSVFYLAALKNIPEDLYEVADLDGAGILQKIRHVTLPGIRPLLIMQLVGTIIGAFHATQRILVMTNGGPAKATHTLGLEIFMSAFTYMRFGYATAVAWLMGAMIIGFTMLQLRYIRTTQPRRLAGDD